MNFFSWLKRQRELKAQEDFLFSSEGFFAVIAIIWECFLLPLLPFILFVGIPFSLGLNEINNDDLRYLLFYILMSLGTFLILVLALITKHILKIIFRWLWLFGYIGMFSDPDNTILASIEFLQGII